MEFFGSVSSHGFTLGLDFVNGVPGDIRSTWPDEWLREYQENDYVLHDPVVIWGMQHDGIASWDELSATVPNREVDVIGAARKFGISNGSVFSITLNRRKTILGISHRDPQLPTTVQDRIVEFLAVSTFRFSRRIEADISFKSKDYLQSAALGLSDKEIAESLQVTPGAVHQLRRRTLTKLGAKSVPQAVLKAYKSRLID